VYFTFEINGETMKKLISFLMIFSILSASYAISGQKIISNIKDNYKKMKTFESDFTQIQMWELASEESRITGKIYMNSDDSFRVEMPEGDYIISNGKTVWRYSTENSQVLIEDVKNNEESMIPGKLFFDFTDRYNLKDYSEKKEDGKVIYMLDLEAPKGKDRFIYRLKVKVNSDFLPVEIESFDLDENKNVYILENIKINTEIAKDKFTYVKKDGTEVIDLRKKK
jgi:chaperone LolA